MAMIELVDFNTIYNNKASSEVVEEPATESIADSKSE
jgi:hypothetical protein